MPYSTEELRSLLFRWLRGVRKNNPRLHPSCDSAIGGIRHILSADGEAPGQPLTIFDEEQVVHTLWDLLFDRAVIFGTGSSNTGWPFFTVTEHGWKVIDAAGPIPYDPDGYLVHLKHASAAIHPTVVRYVEEALAAFRANLPLATTVMLGAASERLFYDLVDSAVAAHTFAWWSPCREMIFRQPDLRENVNKMIAWCTDQRSKFSGAWRELERIEVFNQLAHLIRGRRNDVGHPQDPAAAPPRDHVYALLTAWPDYCKWVYELKADLDAKAGTIS